MAKRTGEFREIVLELDNYQCQFCGYDGREENKRGFLEADHVINRAGKASMDDPDNGITLCALCHKKKTNRELVISHWDRSNKQDGLVVHDSAGNEVEKLWFYAEMDRRLLEQGLEALRVMATSDAAKARILSYVWTFYTLTDASSPHQLVSQTGIDPNEAAEMANIYSHMESIGLEWPQGMNVAKARLVVSCADKIRENEERIEELQETISYAASFSYTDFKKELVEHSFIELDDAQSKQHDLYLYMPRSVFDDNVVIFRSTDDIVASRCAESGGVAVRISKPVYPLRRHGGKVSIKDGLIDRDIQIIDLS